MYPEQIAVIAELIPRVELFSTAQITADEITRGQLEQPEYEFMKGIFMKAGLWEHRDRIFKQDNRTSRTLSEASTRLTRILRSEWEQGKDLEWLFQHSGDRIKLLIKDPAVEGLYVSPSQRSTGFTSFFILTMALYARTADSPDDTYIFLFDEPGTYLHPIAQVNLQRVFAALAQNAQIAYATHSVFLISKTYPTRNRVVRKTEVGTTIDVKPYLGNWKAVRDSLGIMLAQNFLVSDRILLVEGSSDEVYVLSSLWYLIRKKAREVDLNAFAIYASGTSRNQIAMATLMLEEGRRVVVMVDGDDHGSKVKKELTKLAKDGGNEDLLGFLELPKDKSVEDLVPFKDNLLEAVFEALQLLLRSGARALAAGKSEAGCKAELEALFSQTEALTLGRRIDNLTKTWFPEPEPISKLLIAARYEDKARERCDGRPDPALLKVTDKIVDHLGLLKPFAEDGILGSN